MKNLAKALLAAGLLFAALFSCNRASILFSNVLERLDQGFLFEYATEGQFDYNIYFSAEADSRTGILSDLLPHLDSSGQALGLIGLSTQVDKYQMELLPVFYRNTAYMDYLKEKGTSLSGLFLFCKNIGEMVENLTFACRYLLFLAWVIILHFLMKSRPLLYFCMGILCVFASVLKLSNRLFAGIFPDGEFLFHLYADDLIPTLLEASLTFLIFDITFAALEKSRLARRLDPLYADLPALYFLVAFLSGYAGNETRYRPRLEALLPHILEAARTPSRGAKGKRFLAGVAALNGPHTNRTLIRDLVMLQTLLPPR